MRNGPDLWLSILAELPKGAVIAGGAVRDFMLGVEPKDIDVFMGPNDWIMDRPPGWHRIDDKDERAVEYRAVSGIESVSHGQRFGYEVDVIEIAVSEFAQKNFGAKPQRFNPEKLVAGFDFAIARSWFDGQIHDTPEAALDRFFRNVTLLHNNRPERSKRRFERFNERMGGTFTYRERPSS